MKLLVTVLLTLSTNLVLAKATDLKPPRFQNSDIKIILSDIQKVTPCYMQPKSVRVGGKNLPYRTHGLRV